MAKRRRECSAWADGKHLFERNTKYPYGPEEPFTSWPIKGCACGKGIKLRARPTPKKGET